MDLDKIEFEDLTLADVVGINLLFFFKHPIACLAFLALSAVMSGFASSAVEHLF